MKTFMFPKFSHLSAGFGKNHSTQWSLLHRVESWIKLMLWIYTIDHSPLISWQQLSAESLKLILSYIKNGKQKSITENLYRSWEEIITGVPQGSIMVRILFVIFVSDLFFLSKDLQGEGGRAVIWNWRVRW